MTRSDLFIILGAIAIAIVIIKRAIWNAVIMVGKDFNAVSSRLGSRKNAFPALANNPRFFNRGGEPQRAAVKQTHRPRG